MRSWGDRLRDLKKETFAVYLAIRDPRTPWAARVLAGLVIAYALSPIDLIPDFIPFLGHLDDLILVPLGLWLVIRMIPAQVIQESRERAAAGGWGSPEARWATAVVILTWLTLLAVSGLILYRALA